MGKTSLTDFDRAQVRVEGSIASAAAHCVA
jgi:hypothetical protein